MSWRVGRKVPINVYDGDRPVCQCHTELDALNIVAAMNQWETAPVALYCPKPCGYPGCWRPSYRHAGVGHAWVEPEATSVSTRSQQGAEQDRTDPNNKGVE